MLNGKPLCIDGYCGLGGWSEGFLSAGWTVIGFDIEQHLYGEQRYRGQLAIQDMLTVHGAQLKDADCLVMSPPCQNYSYLAMPWSRSKCPLCKGKKHYFAWQLEGDRPPASMDPATWGKPIPCDCAENSRKAKDLRRKWETEGPDNRLFAACFRIQREAIEATQKPCPFCSGEGSDGRTGYTCATCDGSGLTEPRYIPLIVENVRGAVPWVGKRDMPLDQWLGLSQAEKIERGRPQAVFGSFYLWGDVACIGSRVIAGRDLADVRAGRGRFGCGVAPESAGEKVPGFRFDGSGRSFPSASVEAHGVKVPGQIHGKEYAMCRTGANGQKQLHTRGDNQTCGKHRMGLGAESDMATKQGGDWFSDMNGIANHGSRSNARKAASAMIAMIPLPLSEYVAKVHLPVNCD
jgi:C-5 cytosine-specific DNA methylase